jgi:hypothetical protein
MGELQTVDPHTNALQHLLFTILAILTIYKLLSFVLCTIGYLVGNILGVLGVFQRLVNPPEFFISSFILRNTTLSFVSFPVEYAIWVVYEISLFCVKLPFQIIGLVLATAFRVFYFYQKVMFVLFVIKCVAIAFSLYLCYTFVHIFIDSIINVSHTENKVHLID